MSVISFLHKSFFISLFDGEMLGQADMMVLWASFSV